MIRVIISEMKEYEFAKICRVCSNLGIPLDNIVRLDYDADGYPLPYKPINVPTEEYESLTFAESPASVVWCHSCKKYHDVDLPINCVTELFGYDPHDTI